ncbi:solute carrier family 13 member 2 [Pelobates cultripes]|uniref:Solute carrier family 13 member 2 n=1 Tax=Pelobates cultripes TaxID=61616 RepID=A0AAD1QZE6_PELCU|nr:solute carrier family 13 member 2 [Pelobates cultripes]
MVSVWKWVLANRNYFIIFLAPLFLLPLPLVVPSTEANCGFIIIIMALYWCFEALPLAVTALLPVVLFPMMGIMDSTAVCSQYLKDTNMLFVGGLLVAIAVEKWNLHKRIALRVLLIVGVKPAFLILGFMIVTAFLSMWISNTATTAMMIPIAQAVLDQLHNSEERLEENYSENLGDTLKKSMDHHHFTEIVEDDMKNQPYDIRLENSSEMKGKGSLDLALVIHEKESGFSTDAGTTMVALDNGKPSDTKQQNRQQKHLNLCKGMSLSVCYSASIGGVATLTGTPPNLVLKGQIDEVFPGNNNAINFASWFGFAFPATVVLLALTWIWLQIMFLGINFVTDTTVAMFISLTMFFFPSEMPSLKRQDTGHLGEKASIKVPPPLLDWATINQKMPWSIIILLGGGFALAKGSEVSGLSLWIGEKLTPLQNLPPAATAFILCLLVATFTEFTSNVATTTLFLPILASMAKVIKINPLYIMIPCTLSSSLAFMLPVATPPNAIAFSYGQLRVSDMAKAGLLLNILGVLTITLAINSWGFYIFNLGTFPSWANTTGQS